MPSTLNNGFDIKQTNMAKGIACLLLLFHHLFYNSPKYFEMFTPLITTSSGIPLACVFAPKYAPLIYVFLLLVCIGVSVLIEIIKKFTSFNKFVNYIGSLMVKPKSTEKVN